MKLIALLISFTLALTVVASKDLTGISSSTVHIQQLGSSNIVALAQIQYNSSTLDAELISYIAPDLSPTTRYLRVGVYDATTELWSSSTSVTSANSFGKGFTPTLILSLDAKGDVLGIACKSGRIDAGQTRDFGPKVKVVRMIKGKTPELNKPIVLKEGVVEGEIPERTMMQKYWWVGVAALVMLMATGGEK